MDTGIGGLPIIHRLDLAVGPVVLAVRRLQNECATFGKPHLKGSFRLVFKLVISIATNILLENYYYEDPVHPPTNELEKRFVPYETAFGQTRSFLKFVEQAAIDQRQPVAQALASAVAKLPRHAVALKEFAGTTYFRTPGALKAMKEQLGADTSRQSQQALAVSSPFDLSSDGFESTLMERFRQLHMFLCHTKASCLDTGDWPCYPVAGGESHGNFGYDIGRHGAAFAAMAVTPTIFILFAPNLDGKNPKVIPGEMSADLVRQANDLVGAIAERWVVRG
ncbi:hypothetical protein [Bradyrhizobium sp. USDA 4508]